MDWFYAHKWGDGEGHTDKHFSVFLARYLYYTLRYRIVSIICHFKQHDFECEDWGGPESGGMAGTCKRCGYSYETILY